MPTVQEKFDALLAQGSTEAELKKMFIERYHVDPSTIPGDTEFDELERRRKQAMEMVQPALASVGALVEPTAKRAVREEGVRKIRQGLAAAEPAFEALDTLTELSGDRQQRERAGSIRNIPTKASLPSPSALQSAAIMHAVPGSKKPEDLARGRRHDVLPFSATGEPEFKSTETVFDPVGQTFGLVKGAIEEAGKPESLALAGFEEQRRIRKKFKESPVDASVQGGINLALNAVHDTATMIGGIAVLGAQIALPQPIPKDSTSIQEGEKMGKALAQGVVSSVTAPLEPIIEQGSGTLLAKKLAVEPVSSALDLIPIVGAGSRVAKLAGKIPAVAKGAEKLGDVGRAAKGKVADAARATSIAANRNKVTRIYGKAMEGILDKELAAGFVRFFDDGLKRRDPRASALAEQILIGPQRATAELKLLAETFKHVGEEQAKRIAKGTDELPPTPMTPHEIHESARAFIHDQRQADKQKVHEADSRVRDREITDAKAINREIEGPPPPPTREAQISRLETSLDMLYNKAADWREGKFAVGHDVSNLIQPYIGVMEIASMKPGWENMSRAQKIAAAKESKMGQRLLQRGIDEIDEAVSTAAAVPDRNIRMLKAEESDIGRQIEVATAALKAKDAERIDISGQIKFRRSRIQSMIDDLDVQHRTAITRGAMDEAAEIGAKRAGLIDDLIKVMEPENAFFEEIAKDMAALKELQGRLQDVKTLQNPDAPVIPIRPVVKPDPVPVPEPLKPFKHEAVESRPGPTVDIPKFTGFGIGLVADGTIPLPAASKHLPLSAMEAKVLDTFEEAARKLDPTAEAGKLLREKLGEGSVGMLQHADVQAALSKWLVARLDTLHPAIKKRLASLDPQKVIDNVVKLAEEGDIALQIGDGPAVRLSEVLDSIIPANKKLKYRAQQAQTILEDMAGDVAKQNANNTINAHLEEVFGAGYQKLSDADAAAATNAWARKVVEEGEMALQFLPGHINPKQVATAVRALVVGLDRMPAGSKNLINRLANRLDKFVKMDSQHVTVPGGVWADPSMGQIMKWHLGSRDALLNDTFFNGVVSGIKGNHTARSVSSIINNGSSNIALQTVRRGLAGPGLVKNMYDTLLAWETKFMKGKTIDPEMDRIFAALRPTGMVDSNKLVADIGVLNAATKGDIAGSIPILKWVNKQLEKGFTWGDMGFKLEEAVTQFRAWDRRLNEVSPGKYIDLPISNRRTIRATKQADGSFITQTMAGNKLFGKERHVKTVSDLDQIIGKASAKPALDVFVAYDDTSLGAKMLRTLPIAGIGSTYFTWMSAALDIPFVKKGLVRKFMDDPFAYGTNDGKLLAQQGAAALSLSLRRHLIVGGLRQQFLDAKTEELNKALKWATGDEKLSMIKAMSDPGLFIHTDLDSVQFGDPSMTFLKLAANGATKAFGPSFEEAFDPNIPEDQVTPKTKRWRQLMQMSESGQLQTVADGLGLLGLSGGPLVSAWNKVMDSKNEDADFGIDDAFDVAAPFFLGVTASKIARLPGAVAPVGSLPRKLSGRKAPNDVRFAEDFLTYMVRSLTGKAWKTKELIESQNPKEAWSFFGKAKKKWMTSMDINATIRQSKNEITLAEANGDEESRAQAEANLIRAEIAKKVINNEMTLAYARYVEIAEKVGVKTPKTLGE
jgi:hypothetical protein